MHLEVYDQFLPLYDKSLELFILNSIIMICSVI